MYVYISGPMTGVPEFNFPAFDAAAAYLEAQGHHVFNPAEVDRINGFDGAGMTGHENASEYGFNLRAALGDDLAWICLRAEAVATLPGADVSTGATAEIATAIALGLPVVPWDDAFLSGTRPVRRTLADIKAGRRVHHPVRKVHNHGPDEGPGIGCRESLAVDGRPVGECMTAADKATDSDRHREHNRQIRDTLDQLRDSADRRVEALRR